MFGALQAQALLNISKFRRTVASLMQIAHGVQRLLKTIILAPRFKDGAGSTFDGVHVEIPSLDREASVCLGFSNVAATSLNIRDGKSGRGTGRLQRQTCKDFANEAGKGFPSRGCEIATA